MRPRLKWNLPKQSPRLNWNLAWCRWWEVSIKIMPPLRHICLHYSRAGWCVSSYATWRSIYQICLVWFGNEADKVKPNWWSIWNKLEKLWKANKKDWKWCFHSTVGYCPLIVNVVENQFIHIWNVYHNVKSALKYVNRIKIPTLYFSNTI